MKISAPNALTTILVMLFLSSCGGGGGKPSFPVSATISGLAGSGLVIQLNGAGDIPVSVNGQVTFATPIVSGDSYSVTVKSQPTSPWQTCVVSPSSGTVSAAVATAITCTTNTYSVGGTIEGLSANEKITLINSAESLSIGNGSFAFSTKLLSGATFSVRLDTQPDGFDCVLSGASGSVASSDVTSVRVTCTTIPLWASYFSDQSAQMPDLSEFVSSLCGYQTLIQSLITVDLNNDGKKDLLLGAWCDLNGRNLAHLRGTAYNKPVLNSVIALIQQSNGSFLFANRSVFGSDIAPLDGSPVLPQSGDLNGDRRVDLVFETNKEDGRAPTSFEDGSTNFMSYVQALLSQSDGSYRITNVGPKSVSTRPAIIPPEGVGASRGVVIWGSREYQLNESSAWSEKPVPPYVNLMIKIIGSGSTLTVNRFFGDPLGSPAGSGIPLGMYLSRRDSSGNWQALDRLVVAEAITVKTQFLSGQENYLTDQRLITINEQDILTPSIDQACMTGNEEMAGVLEGIPLSKRYVAPEVLRLDQLQGDYTAILFSAQVKSDSLRNFSLAFSQRVKNFFSIQCADVTKDGMGELVVNRLTGGSTSKPTIFMRSTSGFVELLADRIPSSPVSHKGSTSYVEDIDGDGLLDVVYFPVLGLSGGSSRYSLGFFKAKKALKNP